MNDFEVLSREIEKLKKEVSFFNAGKTALNNNILCFVLGNKDSKNKIVLQGGMHAREYITSFLLIKMIEFLKDFKTDACLYILPIVNIDGVKISICGERAFENKLVFKSSFLQFLCQKSDFGQIKCNAMGVDLNTNFEAMWGQGKSNLKEKTSCENFVGYYFNSEREVKTLINLTEVLRPKLTLSYHSKGEVFYWGFGKSLKYSSEYLDVEKRCKIVIKKVTNYKPIFTKNSCGGYKDWCIDKMKIPSFTLEVGSEYLKHPIGKKNLKTIFDKNKYLVLNLIKEVFYKK